jgi:hypothetical protein
MSRPVTGEDSTVATRPGYRPPTTLAVDWNLAATSERERMFVA